MGSVKEHYLQPKKAGEQYLGWVGLGRHINDVLFATLPPYYECGDNADDVRETILTMLIEFTVGGHGIQGAQIS